MTVPTKKIENGEVSILVSPGYGAGWSSWSSGETTKQFLIFDRGLVEMAERKAPVSEVEEYLKENGFDSYICLLGWPCTVEKLPVGTPFHIDEYDGYETVHSPSYLDMIA